MGWWNRGGGVGLFVSVMRLMACGKEPVPQRSPVAATTPPASSATPVDLCASDAPTAVDDGNP
jgi:hypothetical protein